MFLAVSSILIKDTIDSSEKELNLDGVFVAIGHDPNVGLLEGFIELDDKGYIKTGFTTETSTSVPGVFAAGDIVRGASLVVWGVRDGRDAADAIHSYIMAQSEAPQAAVAGA